MTTHHKWTVNDIPDQTGKIVLITGANSGLGYETALALAGKGAQVIMACRSLAKGNEARQHVRAQFPDASVEVMQLDLGSLTSVRQFAKTFTDRYNRLDMLINNAGIMAPPRQETVDGFEAQFGINHLGHFALTGLLIETITQTPASRIVNISSSAQYMGKINFNDLQHTRSYSRYLVYSQSKLANVLFTFELQRRLEQAGFDTISVVTHPGFSSTHLQINTANATGSKLERFTYGVMMPSVAQSQAQGALPQLYAATVPGVKGGEHFGPDGFLQMRGYPTRHRAARAAYNEADAKKLWEVSERLTGVEYTILRRSREMVS
ncbi:MAG: SDR family NAD(P)-dependent oxidoreductase [Chloroflexi bacterium AL-W]|nr:SDR family NAD(P)-dependent oxidoreductase [Chloroflexi bacterium AL-N1]NOK67722.1 SDR family NAD(P)-dependent oxidoreductase [Chloroflexi bacterium AL-N10]NOK75508.1 SDR family NAD(P)-dependent oxidoreductase [Chloroflexi bacterium AL-N5]NOK82296.1 SDR family NAD(P)-dependent oxidoreductase [Chloroflexi bacterium AL-W]NOK90141.1 SDR family NAD(P)-dependent oxidoreductase [Chloroflexi bacterium AL-N15]